jgi:hypothetical protein
MQVQSYGTNGGVGGIDEVLVVVQLVFEFTQLWLLILLTPPFLPVPQLLDDRTGRALNKH